MNLATDNKTSSLEWEARARYFETKPAGYFRAVIVLAVLTSILLFFLKEMLLILLVWILVFVVYVRSTVEPPTIKYTLGKFGIHFFDYHLNFQNIVVFTVVKKREGELLRILANIPNSTELTLVLPADKHLQQSIINTLKERVPYVDKVPKTEIEKLADFLGRISGLS